MVRDPRHSPRDPPFRPHVLTHNGPRAAKVYRFVWKRWWYLWIQSLAKDGYVFSFLACVLFAVVTLRSPFRSGIRWNPKKESNDTFSTTSAYITHTLFMCFCSPGQRKKVHSQVCDWLHSASGWLHFGCCLLWEVFAWQNQDWRQDGNVGSQQCYYFQRSYQADGCFSFRLELFQASTQISLQTIFEKTTIAWLPSSDCRQQKLIWTSLSCNCSWRRRG